MKISMDMSRWLMRYEHNQTKRLEMQEISLQESEVTFGNHNGHDYAVCSNFDLCRILVHLPSHVNFSLCAFRRCSFEPKGRVKVAWFDNLWHDCTFTGKYISTHFGMTRDYNAGRQLADVLVRNCDFSKTTMHGCGFINTEVASVKFPPWPCFTMLDPKTNFEKWRPTLNSIQDHLMSVRFTGKGQLDAEVFHWPTLAKDYKIDADPEEVKRKLQTLDGVLL